MSMLTIFTLGCMSGRLAVTSPVKKCGSFKELALNGNAGWEFQGKRYQAPEFEIYAHLNPVISLDEAVNKLNLAEHHVIQKFLDTANQYSDSTLPIHLSDVHATQRGDWEVKASADGWTATKMISLLVWRDPERVAQREKEVAEYQ